MTWLTPGVAGVAGAIAVPLLLLLYFLKLRRREVEVSTTLLWKKSIQDLQANAPFQKLRRNILLLLQLLALGAALLALAQPEIRMAAPSAGKSILLIDRSGSMGATDATDGSRTEVSRLDSAKRAATDFIDSMERGSLFSPGDTAEAMVIAFDRSADVVLPYTSDKGRLRSAIASIEQTDAPTNLAEAMRLAGGYTQREFREQVGMMPGAPIYLFSDGAIPDLDKLDLPPESTIVYRAIGSPDAQNVAITSFRAERSFTDRASVSLFVGLQSTFDAPRDVDVQLAINGLVSAVRSVSLPAADERGPGVGGVVFKLDRRDSAVVVVNVLLEDDISADNAARVYLPPARRLRVAVVEEQPSFYLETALKGLPLTGLETLTPAEFRALSESGRLDSFDVYVLAGWVPVPATGKATDTMPEGADGALPAGRFLVLGAAPGVRGLGVVPGWQPPETSVMVDWDRSHPVLRHAGLEHVVFARPLGLETTTAVRTIAHGVNGPAIVEVAQGATRAIVVGFDPAASNWPFDVGFVLFLGSAIRYLGDDISALEGTDLEPGSTLTTRLPPGATDVRLVLPDETTRTLTPAPDGSVSWGPIPRAGIYQVRWRGEPGPGDQDVGSGRALRVLPVNMTDAQESRAGYAPVITLPTGDLASVEGGSLARQNRSLWRWLLLAALGVMLVEWWVYNRKVHL